MKEILENKISDIINYIVEKSPEDITYNEYRILDCKLREIKYESEQKERNEKMMKSMSECLFSGLGNSAVPALPDE